MRQLCDLILIHGSVARKISKELKSKSKYQIRFKIKDLRNLKDNKPEYQDAIEALQSNRYYKWKDGEDENLIKAVLQFGFDWKKLQEMVPTRDLSQIKSKLHDVRNKKIYNKKYDAITSYLAQHAKMWLDQQKRWQVEN